jgi:VWA domain-containing protein
MKLCALFATLAATTAFVHAGGLEEYAPTWGPHSPSQLVESSCEVAIELRGAVAVVEQKQRIANKGGADLAAIATLDLPRGAAITGFSAAGTDALGVPAKAPAAIAESPDVLGVDPAALFAVAGDQYRALVQPIAPGREVQLVTRYVAVARAHSGGLSLVLPAHDDGTCKVTLRAQPGPGATVKKLVPGASFTLAGQPVTIGAELDVAGTLPIAWKQTAPLADGWSASLVTVLGPRVKAATGRRAVFVVDTSKSMDAVGRAQIAKVVHALGTALPPNSELEAVLYDRTATRVLGEARAATPGNLALIEDAIAKRPAANGSDLARAFQLVQKAITGARGQAMVVVITDGVLPELASGALQRALGATPSSADLHAIVLDPAHTTSPGADTLREPIDRLGGAYVEVDVDELDTALAAIDGWLRPSWLELAMEGVALPSELPAGGGATQLAFHRTPPAFVLAGHGDTAFKIPAQPAPAAPIAALALRAATGDDLDAVTRAHAFAAHPTVDAAHALAVLATTGRVAASRRAVVAGGGKYERTIALADPPAPEPASPARAAAVQPSAIAETTLERMFRDQLQPRAFVCYQRALPRNPNLTGTVRFQFRLGRGEVTDVQMVGTGDAQFDACLLDAGYAMVPPSPDFSINADDQTIANYPLTFEHSNTQTYVVLGDADSSSPIDVEAIEKAARKPVKVDARTPLGGLKPPPAVTTP